VLLQQSAELLLVEARVGHVQGDVLAQEAEPGQRLGPQDGAALLQELRAELQRQHLDLVLDGDLGEGSGAGDGVLVELAIQAAAGRGGAGEQLLGVQARAAAGVPALDQGVGVGDHHEVVAGLLLRVPPQGAAQLGQADLLAARPGPGQPALDRLRQADAQRAEVDEEQLQEGRLAEAGREGGQGRAGGEALARRADGGVVQLTNVAGHDVLLAWGRGGAGWPSCGVDAERPRGRDRKKRPCPGPSTTPAGIGTTARPPLTHRLGSFRTSLTLPRFSATRARRGSGAAVRARAGALDSPVWVRRGFICETETGSKSVRFRPMAASLERGGEAAARERESRS
jgi:hypothetical protein